MKRLKLTASAAAHRELDIGLALSGRELTHVVPILDFGQDAGCDRYFLIMPICERSLQEEIIAKGTMAFVDACVGARHILAGLREVGDIVHRDLKPANVLLYEGRWCIADFGIAKFVEDSTSLETLRDSLTPLYAAPEQWEGQRPTKATDIYALGCIMHAMLTGAPPFTGSLDDIRHGHVETAAPPLTGATNRISAIVGQMLRKVPTARPVLERCATVFAEEVNAAPASPVQSMLAQAANVVASKAAEREAAERAAEAQDAEWEALVKEASHEFSGLISRLFDTVCEASDEVRRTPKSVAFGDGHLIISDVNPRGRNPQGGPNLAQSRWTVAAYASATLHAGGRRDFYEWGASFVYAATPEDPSFRWREVSFFRWGVDHNSDEPFSLEPYQREFDLALSNVVSGYQPAVGPVSIDGEDEEAFQARWISLLTKAATGKLARPSQMPVPQGFFG